MSKLRRPGAYGRKDAAARATKCPARRAVLHPLAPVATHRLTSESRLMAALTRGFELQNPREVPPVPSAPARPEDGPQTVERAFEPASTGAPRQVPNGRLGDTSVESLTRVTDLTPIATYDCSCRGDTRGADDRVAPSGGNRTTRPAALHSTKSSCIAMMAPETIRFRGSVRSGGFTRFRPRSPQCERTRPMLEYRHNCERCGRELAVDDHQVYICSFECTWCSDCADTFPRHTCPNCGGNLALRPIQPRHLRHTSTVGEHLHSGGLYLLARTA